MTYYVYNWECQTCGCTDNEYHDNNHDVNDSRVGYCCNCEDEESRTAIIQLLAYDQWLNEDQD
jgi:hypothetical protein